MFILEREGETVDDGPENLQELSDAIVTLSFVNKPVKRVVYLLADVGPQTQELAVNAVQNGLQKVAFSRVLAVEQVEQLHEKLLVDVLFGRVGLKVGRLQKAQKELVHDLEVGPGGLQIRLVLFRVELGAGRVRARRQRSEHVQREHFDDFFVGGLGHYAPIGRDELNHFVQRLTFDLFVLEVRERVGGEVEDRSALLDLVQEELFSLRLRYV